MPTIASPRYYVYVLARPNGQPFYVGKGKGRRVYKHEEEARRACPCHRCNVIRKIWRDDGQVLRYIVFETDDEQEAFAYECETIALHGRHNLCNQSDGGGGASGAVISAERRSKVGAASKARWADPEFRAKMSALQKARYADPTERAKQSARLEGAWADPILRTKQKTAMKARWTEPEYRANVTIAVKEALKSPAERARRSAAMKNAYANPTHRANLSAGVKASWARRKAKAQDDAIRIDTKEDPWIQQQ